MKLVIMKILLAAVNAKYIHSNLAVYSLQAYAKGYCDGKVPNIEIAEFTINQQPDEILAEIYRKKPDMVCFSCYIWNITYVEWLLAEVKKVLPDVKIWLGGPEVSYDAENVLLKFPQVTGVIRGEGEHSFMLLAAGMDYRQIPGISYRVGAALVRENPSAPILNMDAIPFPYHDIEIFQNRIIYYESSRGCPFSCSYCLSSIDKQLRFRSVELVTKELQFFIDHEVSQVKFVDRTFNCRHDHALAIWSYLKEHDKGKTNFHFEISADLLNEEELELIASMRPGLIQLEIGIQSTNPETIQEIRRTMKFTDVKAAVQKIAARQNIHQHLDLIAGLPGEDYQSFQKSFNDVYVLQPDQLQLGFLKVLKGSVMQENAAKYDLLYQERVPYEVLSTKWLSYEEVLKLKGVEEVVEVYYNSGQFTNTLSWLAGKFDSPFSMYEALSQFYVRSSLSYSRLTRYEMLFQFAARHCAKRKNTGDNDIKILRERLVLDFYLRENVKNRPDFAGEATVTKAETAAFYDREALEYRYLKGYEQFDKRQLRKMTHLERIAGRLLLFDYRNRSILNNQATVYEVMAQEEK